MTDDSPTRDGRSERRPSDATPAADRWLPGGAVLETRLPDDVGAALGRLLGEGPIETLGEWIAAVRRLTGGGSIAVDDLCHAAEGTAHWGEIDGERDYFRCFYDAVLLSALVERPVGIRTESPDGTEIRARADGAADLTVVPETAVVSVGVGETVRRPPDDGPTHAAVYAAVCPFVRAFPDREAYARWERSVPAATVATSLEGATGMAAALVA